MRVVEAGGATGEGVGAEAEFAIALVVDSPLVSSNRFLLKLLLLLLPSVNSFIHTSSLRPSVMATPSGTKNRFDRWASIKESASTNEFNVSNFFNRCARSDVALRAASSNAFSYAIRA